MLANSPDTFAQFGNLRRDVHRLGTFGHELLDFIASELPCWRDRPDRPKESSETILTTQLCAHLNSVARHSAGWDILQFRVEEADEQNRGRRVDLVASPCGVDICIEGRKHTDFDTLMPIECKRLPTPASSSRDAREYVTSRFSSTGGIQRFKAGHHGASHTLGAMIGYVQEETASIWHERVTGWIRELAATQPGWTTKELLKLERKDPASRLAIFRSSHQREKGLSEIELRHFWLEMN